MNRELYIINDIYIYTHVHIIHFCILSYYFCVCAGYLRVVQRVSSCQPCVSELPTIMGFGVPHSETTLE